MAENEFYHIHKVHEMSYREDKEEKLAKLTLLGRTQERNFFSVEIVKLEDQKLHISNHNGLTPILVAIGGTEGEKLYCQNWVYNEVVKNCSLLLQYVFEEYEFASKFQTIG